MNQKVRMSLIFCSILLGLAAVVLLAAALAMPAGKAAAHVQADICVHQGESIQAAIDAANPGDLIAIEGETFTETLVITKSLTLSGGWQVDCVSQPLTSTTIIKANYLGRVFTIKTPPTADAIAVTLEHLSVVYGNASGLGGAQPQDPPDLPALTTWIDENLITDTMPTTPTLSANLQAQLSAIQAQGSMPGGAAGYAALEERMQSLMDPAKWPAPEIDQAALPRAPRPAAPDNGGVDCGGGIFVDGASLSTTDVSIRGNVASTTGPGYGGGLCVVNLPAGGSLTLGYLTDIQGNTGSTYAEGIGGGLYVDGGDPGSPNMAAVSLETETMFWKNTASTASRGYGGNLAAYNSGAFSLNGTMLAWGLAGRSNDKSDDSSGLSYGGAVYLQNCPGASFDNVMVFNNMADAGGVMGFGGGVAAVHSDNLSIGAESKFARNTAQANLGLYGAVGFGGAVFLAESSGAHIQDSTMEFNVGSLYSQGQGGALAAVGSSGLTVQNNKIFDNIAAYFPNGTLVGGGLSLIASQQITITDNDFQRNAVGVLNQTDFFGFGPGGGAIGMDKAIDVLIRGNSFTENTGMFSGLGHGAGVDVTGTSNNVEIDHNTFTRNVASRSPSVYGPKVIGEGAGIIVDDADSVNIHHNTFANNAGTTAEYSGFVVFISGAIVGSEGFSGRDIRINANQFLNNGRGLALDGDFETGAIRVYASETCTITNNIIANTTGRGIQLEYKDVPHGPNTHAWVVNNTLVNNNDFAIGLAENWSQDFVTIANNIVMSHTNGMVSESYNTVNVDHNLFYANGTDLNGPLTMTASVLADPRFVNPATLDYHLLLSSPARDSGAGIPPAPHFDADDIARPFGPAVDRGAYEFHQWLYFFPWIAK